MDISLFTRKMRSKIKGEKSKEEENKEPSLSFVSTSSFQPVYPSKETKYP
jgi:hypothetical protein